MLWLPGIGEKPYSILNCDPFSIAVTSVGPFSTALFDLDIGSRVWARGPFGQGFKLEGSRHLLVGGGYGAAPLLFLAEQARNRNDGVSVCLGARSAADLMMVDAFIAWAVRYLYPQTMAVMVKPAWLPELLIRFYRGQRSIRFMPAGRCQCFQRCRKFAEMKRYPHNFRGKPICAAGSGYAVLVSLMKRLANQPESLWAG